jgi:hypothetical protein
MPGRHSAAWRSLRTVRRSDRASARQSRIAPAQSFATDTSSSRRPRPQHAQSAFRPRASVHQAREAERPPSGHRERRDVRRQEVQILRRRRSERPLAHESCMGRCSSSRGARRPERSPLLLPTRPRRHERRRVYTPTPSSVKESRSPARATVLRSAAGCYPLAGEPGSARLGRMRRPPRQLRQLI